MMWAAKSQTGKTNLVHTNGYLTVQRYCDEILQPHVLPTMQNEDRIFQQDNATPYSARISTAFLQQTNMIVL